MDTTMEEEEDGVTVDEFISSILHTKSKLGDRMKFSNRKFKKKQYEDELTSESVHSSVSPGTNSVYTPMASSKVSVFTSQTSNEESLTSQPLPQSCSKMFRSVSTPEMNTKFLPTSFSNAKSDVHRKMDFSSTSSLFRRRYQRKDCMVSESLKGNVLPMNGRTLKESKLLYSHISSENLPDLSITKELDSSYSTTKSNYISNLFNINNNNTDSLKIFGNSRLSQNSNTDKGGKFNITAIEQPPGDGKLNNYNHLPLSLDSKSDVQQEKDFPSSSLLGRKYEHKDRLLPEKFEVNGVSVNERVPKEPKFTYNRINRENLFNQPATKTSDEASRSHPLSKLYSTPITCTDA